MIAASVITGFVGLLFLLVFRVLSGRAADKYDDYCLNTKENEIDIEVLALLLSKKENDYLRRSVGDEAFREIKRKRIALASAYLKAINRNTRKLIAIVQSAQRSGDTQVAQAARELLQIALRVRLYAPLVQLCLAVEWILPTANLIAPTALNPYREAIGKIVFILNRLQEPPMKPTLAG